MCGVLGCLSHGYGELDPRRVLTSAVRCRDGDSQQLLQQAAARFQQLEATTLREIASELRGQDPYLFMRAISPGASPRQASAASVTSQS